MRKLLLSFFVFLSFNLLSNNDTDDKSKCYEFDKGGFCLQIEGKESFRTDNSSPFVTRIYANFKKDTNIVSQDLFFDNSHYKKDSFYIDIEKKDHLYSFVYSYKIKGKKNSISQKFAIKVKENSKENQFEIKELNSPYNTKELIYIYNLEEKYFEMYDSKLNKIANVVFFDNAPDDFHDGLRRVIENKKYGFINKKNKITVKPSFDFAEPFYKGYSIVANDVVFKAMDEHTMVTGGKWGVIDKNGKVLIELKYDSIKFESNKKFIGVLDGKEETITLK
ncbi:WG repeat-containing protein [bacterium]|nr:WG repeat-containing protein [bacterium]